MKKAKFAVVLLLGIMLVAAIPLGVIKVKAASETHTLTFVNQGCFPKHLPDSYTGQVALAGLPDVPSEVQGVYWNDGDEWLFWAPGAPGCTLSTMGGGHTFDYLVCVTGLCEWEISLPSYIPTPSPSPSPTLTTINGICYGPFRDGQNPDVGIFPTVGEIREDLIQIKSITTKIRSYGCSDTLYNITEEASSLGISVVQGVWLDQNPETSENEVRSAIDLANRGLVESVVVGNEILLTETLSESQLIDYIRQVKDSVPEDVKVTTAEPWHIWLENPSLVDAVDYILIHVHPFWEGKPIETAAEYVIERYYEVKAHSGNKDVVIGETGWPSGGTPEDALVPPNVVPSEENLLMFLKEFSQLAYEHSIEYYFFSAYDEEWKWKERCVSQGMADLPLPLDRNLAGRLPGSSWGIFYSDGQIKSELVTLFPQVVNSTSRTTRVIFDTRGLAVFYDMGVDSSYRRQDWLEMSGEEMQMAYPAGQSWGAVFITVGEPVDHPRPWKDFSQFQSISVEMKGEHGGEFVKIGLKDAYDPDDGSEAKIMVSGLTPTWQTYDFPLSSFYTADLGKLYVVVEFVFSGSEAQTIYFRNIKYLL